MERAGGVALEEATDVLGKGELARAAGQGPDLGDRDRGPGREGGRELGDLGPDDGPSLISSDSEIW